MHPAARRVGRLVRRLAADTSADLRGRDLPLFAAGLTFYALLAFIPLLLVSLWLASLLLGPEQVRVFGADLSRFTGSAHGIGPALRFVTRAGSRLSIPAVITSALLGLLYGEGLARAFGTVSNRARQKRRSLRGRALTPIPLLLAGALISGGLATVARLAAAASGTRGFTIVSVLAGFFLCWVGVGALLAVVYSLFGPSRPSRPAVLWAAAGAGSYLAGQTMGFLFVLQLPVAFGRPFAGSTALGVGCIVAFWLYLNHVVVLLGYVVALRLTDGPRG